MKKTSDLLIVGAGPAGLSAALQAARDGLSLRVITRDPPGGLLWAAHRLDNLPGFPGGVGGAEFAERLIEQASCLRIKIELGEVTTLKIHANGFQYLVESTKQKKWGTAHAVILAVGTEPLPLEFPTRRSRRIHRDIRTLPLNLMQETIAIIGGGEAAVDTALSVAKRGGFPRIFVRGEQLKAPDRLVEEAKKKGVVFHFRTEVKTLWRQKNAVVVRLKSETVSNDLSVAHLIFCIGRRPTDALWQSILGAIPLYKGISSSLPGLFLAGDLIHETDRYALTAMGDGQRAARMAFVYLQGVKKHAE